MRDGLVSGVYIYDLRRPPGYPLSLQKSVITDFCSHTLSYSRFRVRHDAGVFRPNGRHEQKRNGEKTRMEWRENPKTEVFWVLGRSN